MSSAAEASGGQHREPDWIQPAEKLTLGQRAMEGVRYLLAVGVLVGVVGLLGRLLAWPLITSTVGPTAYVFAAHPKSETARFRNAVIGHSLAIAVGLLALLVFGLLRHPSVSTLGAPTLPQVGAAATAGGVTLGLQELFVSHHAPAAATALLVATGLAKPGPGLIGLVLGLAIVIAVGPWLGRWPLARRSAAREEPITPQLGRSG